MRSTLPDAFGNGHGGAADADGRMKPNLVTLQFGPFANHVGAHYWNLQDDTHGRQSVEGASEEEIDSIDWRVEYAERRRSDDDGSGGKESVGYAPRVVVFDMSGSVSTRRASVGELDEASCAEATWSGGASVFRAPLAKRSAFVLALEREAAAIKALEARREIEARAGIFGESDEEDESGRRRKLGGVGQALELGASGRARREKKPELDDPEEITRQIIEAASKLDVEADHWSDYMKVELHPRSLFPIVGKWVNVDVFDGFGEGLDWIDSEDRREDVRDAVRYWAEDCDTLGGFHVICDDSSGFAGVCSRAIEDIKDDYDNAPICVFSVRRPAQTERKRIDMLNAGFASTALAGNADLFCPLEVCDAHPTMGGLRPKSWFHASSVIALAIEGVTTPWRLKSASSVGSMSLHEMSKFMTNRAPASYVLARLSMPAPRLTGVDDAETLTKSLRSMTPMNEDKNDDDGDGDTPFAESYVMRGVESDLGGALDGRIGSSILDACFARELYRCPRHKCVVNANIPIPLPYPKLFSPRDITSASCITSLTSSSASSRILTRIESDFSRARRSALGKALLDSWSCDAVEQGEMVESLISTARAYAGNDDYDDF